MRGKFGLWLAAACFGGVLVAAQPQNVRAADAAGIQGITASGSVTAGESETLVRSAYSVPYGAEISSTESALPSLSVGTGDTVASDGSGRTKADDVSLKSSSTQVEETKASADSSEVQPEETKVSADSSEVQPEEVKTSSDSSEAQPEDAQVSADDADDQTEIVSAPTYEKTVQDGTYVIMSGVEGFKALDISGGSTADGANVQLYDANGTRAQKFNVAWDEEKKSYSIVNVNSGKSLHAAGNGSTPGTNLEQSASDGSDGQRWYIVKNGSGYKIISVLNGLAVDICYGSTDNGTNAWLYTPNQSAAQMFQFLTSSDAYTNFSDGVYTFATAVNSSVNLDISSASMEDGGNLQLYPGNGSNAQKFILTSAGGNSWRVTSFNSGMTVGVDGNGGQSGSNVHQENNSNGINQRWYIRNTGDGTCYIVPAEAPDKALDAANGSSAAGTNVQIYRKNGTAAQKFIASRVNYTAPVSGEYFIVSSASDKTLDISNGSRKMEANLQIYDQNGTRAQKFIVHDLGNGFVTIENANSRHYLDVESGSTANAANVQQYRNNGTMAQSWIVRDNGDGTFSFINANSSKVLDIANGSTENRANVQQYSWNGTGAQRFRMVQTAEDVSTEAIDYSVEPKPVPVDEMDARAAGYASSTPYLILVNCGRHLVNVYYGSQNNWKRAQSYACGNGAAATPTVHGVFTVGIKQPSFGHGYTCWYATQIYGNYLFHSVLYYPGSQTSIMDGRLGVAVSHGCVRLAIENAKWIYDNIPRGTKVVVYN